MSITLIVVLTIGIVGFVGFPVLLALKGVSCVGTKFQENTELYDFTLSRIQMNRWGSSKEVADVCVFLESTMSDYLTGEVLKVDGGWSAG